ncbi:MAG TPA: hypothetical protein VG056_08035, partial [Pirellulales bacterium]|nr:hypothetical protein [Pirellulales bacterium]
MIRADVPDLFPPPRNPHKNHWRGVGRLNLDSSNVGRKENFGIHSGTNNAANRREAKVYSIDTLVRFCNMQKKAGELETVPLT